jgi:hypothetical protein
LFLQQIGTLSLQTEGNPNDITNNKEEEVQCFEDKQLKRN